MHINQSFDYRVITSMDLIESVFTFTGRWIIHDCFIPTLLNAVYITYPILLSSLLLRVCVLWVPLHRALLDLLSTILGVAVLWWYYEATVVYFFVLVVLVYVLMLLIPSGKRGVAVAGACVLFTVVWYVTMIFMIIKFFSIQATLHN